eukprot:CAMPEP_0184211294 /NCGR_PEP_ID=MMETSP0976-20121227/13057_1 /TAXON_ID=483370 /ORGANISM="non described non described, Strain CCMP2097" /LENGTH=303 /DNA_ID=CAMNT_0026515997 /DNA_START=382 /DNA_END=1288 /DNA_ORIENTATION=+
MPEGPNPFRMAVSRRRLEERKIGATAGSGLTLHPRQISSFDKLATLWVRHKLSNPARCEYTRPCSWAFFLDRLRTRRPSPRKTRRGGGGRAVSRVGTLSTLLGASPCSTSNVLAKKRTVRSSSPWQTQTGRDSARFGMKRFTASTVKRIEVEREVARGCDDRHEIVARALQRRGKRHRAALGKAADDDLGLCVLLVDELLDPLHTRPEILLIARRRPVQPGDVVPRRHQHAVVQSDGVRRGSREDDFHGVALEGDPVRDEKPGHALGRVPQTVTPNHRHVGALASHESVATKCQPRATGAVAL